MGWPFFKNIKEFNKTGTIRAGTVRELRDTKVHYKDTCRDRSRATGDGRRDRQVSLGGTAANVARHRVTTNSEAGDQ
ncbi:MAG: hypothetical protein EZS28_039136 [Streblomastix strix]|uniref:Uncharacterized protein n=1 Tax=Streblomastix strix TaxID=222440 RepID=A0A5J4U3Z7_9EUKA|nr:MAG: hypothetical protein EZS28_039136 [Streblomastix strix]